ncbi:hypothetical protein D1007_27139 [Hordeum vulgare]|nr:hypothetical protein D1007_27139 [Hordeum vulgare]
MAGSADRLVQSRRRRREVEEGEVVSGYRMGSDTDTDDEDARYYLHPAPLHDDRRQRMMVTVARPVPAPAPEGVVVGGGGSVVSGSRSITRGSSPTSSLGSDGTISDVSVAGGDAAAKTASFPACPVCHRQFHTSKAVHGHMRVHAQPREEDKVSAVVSAVDESGSVSMATVVAEPKILDDPMTVEVASSDHVVPGSCCTSSASVEPRHSQSAAHLSMAIVVAAAAPPAAVSEQVDIAPTPPAPQQVPISHPAAPAPEPAAVYLPPPAPAQQHINAQDLAARRGFPCKECCRWFPTHQGLGGHVAGHKNRRIAAAAAAAIAAGIDPIDDAAGAPRPVRQHTCKDCGAVYPSGVKLGGHMRKHYKGKLIVKRKRPARLLFPADLGLAIHGHQAPQVPAAEVAAQPPQPPAVPAGCLRIFGVTIVQEAKEEEPPVEDKQ